jgi:two-component sensor histidine kinase
MAAKPAPAAILSDLSSRCFEHSAAPMVTVEGATHIVRYANPAFCRLTDKSRTDLVGTPFCGMLPETDECLALLDRVHRTGIPESYTKLSFADSEPALSSYMMWPVMGDERARGVVIQVVETAPLHERMRAMNEALMLGSLRLHEVTADVAALNIQLKAEIGEREQRERDALMLTNEVAHRIKNNLQIMVGLIEHEVRSAAAPCVAGFRAMEARIGAIAELYDLISQGCDGETIAVDAYLREIARTMSQSLLGSASGIKIEVEVEALTIDSIRAAPLGLLINELGTNAIKHAFPGGAGRVLLCAKRIGEQMELTVVDNGVGMKDKYSGQFSQKHGSDYLAIFVRQLDGTIAVSASEGSGTTVRVLLPLVAAR